MRLVAGVRAMSSYRLHCPGDTYELVQPVFGQRARLIATIMPKMDRTSTAIADPRARKDMFHNAFRTVHWQEPSQAITAQHAPSNGAMCVADPRPDNARQFTNIYRVVDWADPSGTVIGRTQPSDGALSVADPRTDQRRNAALGVVNWEEPSGTVAGESLPGNGAFSVADPRPNIDRARGDNWYGGGHYGVTPWTSPTGAVSAAASHDNGCWSVADPRPPEPSDRLVAVIQSLDGTWHRPFSTLELAALQSLVDPEEHVELEGLSDAAWRERIGNAVPPDAAQAIAETMGRTLLMAWSGQGFMLSNLPIWVQPMAVALSVQPPLDSGE